MISEQVILFFILSYFIGAIPSAFWIGRFFYSIDIREFGSGNSGATNAFRVLGYKIGIIVLLFDIFKTWLAVSLVDLFSITSISNPELLFETKIAFGIASVIGHIFPIYIGFRGGKGIASLLGLIIALEAEAAFYSIIVFLLVLFITRYVSVSSILASFAFPVIVIFILNSSIISLNLFAIFLPFLSLITHQKNIERLIRGEETKVIFGSK